MGFLGFCLMIFLMGLLFWIYFFLDFWMGFLLTVFLGDDFLRLDFLGWDVWDFC